MPVLETPATLRIGIHTGSCMSGVVGTKNFKFCLFGDMTVKAAQMEKWGVPDCIHASQELVDFVPEEAWEVRSGGKKTEDSDDMGQTYVLHVN